MDFLKTIDRELSELYFETQGLILENPVHAVSKAQLFVKKLYDKLPEDSGETFIDQFEEDLAWLIGCSQEITFGEALAAHQLLYRVINWYGQKFEAPVTKIHAVAGSETALTEADVLKIIEDKVLTTLCGMIKEMDTLSSALDEAEKEILKLSATQQRLAQVELELARLKKEARGFNGMLKTLPRTPTN